jgi:hypothetical protein
MQVTKLLVVLGYMALGSTFACSDIASVDRSKIKDDLYTPPKPQGGTGGSKASGGAGGSEAEDAGADDSDAG